MTNAEKYHDEIWNICVLNATLLAVQNNSPALCTQVSCGQCQLNPPADGGCKENRAKWLAAEYVDPAKKIDWYAIPIDTPILVSNNQSTWFTRYFAYCVDNIIYAWPDGATSWSADGFDGIAWPHAKLRKKEIFNMKIYIVTCGSYSDYYIDKVFTDKNKAEEYRQWCPNANDIEEYETEDTLEIKKTYYIHLQYRLDSFDPPEIRIDKSNLDEFTFPYVYVYNSPTYIEINMRRCVPAENWNEDFYVKKYTKAIYDYAAIVKAKLAEGFSIEQINELFSAKDKNKGE